VTIGDKAVLASGWLCTRSRFLVLDDAVMPGGRANYPRRGKLTDLFFAGAITPVYDARHDQGVNWPVKLAADSNRVSEPRIPRSLGGLSAEILSKLAVPPSRFGG
jgi:hypothetical protein